MEILVCIKRVPAVGGQIALTDDGRQMDTRFLGFTISPHEECAVEEAVRMVESHGGTSTVLTLGVGESEEQLRAAFAIGIDRGILLETDGSGWDPVATAAAIVDVIRSEREAGRSFDVLLFGNEAADTGDFQVGIRVAHALSLPCVVGVKRLEFADGKAIARREAASGGSEIFEVGLPAVFTVKEGLNLPRYPSVPGRMRAKKKEIDRLQPVPRPGGLTLLRLKVPPDQGGAVEILGTGPEAAPAVVALLQRLGVVER